MLLNAPAFEAGLLIGVGALAWLAFWAYKTGDAVFQREFWRKAFHQLILLYLAAYFLIGYPRVAWAMGAWTLFAFCVETLRLKAAWAKPFFKRYFGGIIRDKENVRFSGAFYVTLGLTLTIAAFGDRPRLVTAAMMFLAFGDAVSPLVGLRWNLVPYTIFGTRRSVGGTLAGFLVTGLLGIALGFSWPAALGAAAVFSVVDNLPVWPDDNFWIPVAASSSLYVLDILRH